jgi:type IV pilus biogenesis protein CpaD/CtpE
MHKEKTLTLVLLWLGLSALPGCSALSGGPTATEQDFGTSVRQMIASQTANPQNPADAEPIPTGDGQRIDNALKTYRSDVGVPERVRDDIVIDVSE